MTPKVTAPGTRGFYGWIAMSGVLLAQFVLVGAFLMAFGVFLPVICAEFGWSRGAVSIGFFLGLLCMGLPTPIWGVLVARLGPRTTLVIGNTLLSLGLVGLSLIQEVWHIYIFYCLVGLGAGLGGAISCSTIASNWFVRKRSLVLGILTAAGCLGGFVFPPLITMLISSIGWRMSWLALAGMDFAGAFLIGGLILIRNRPEDMGQVPDGISVESTDRAGITSRRPESGSESVRWQAKQVLRHPTTWLIAAFSASYAFALGTTGAHQVAFVQDLGFNPMIAATTISLVSIMAIFGSLGFGALALRFNIRYLASGFFAIQMIALILLLTTKGLTSIYIYSIIFGTGNGALLASLPTFVGAYYGRASYSRVLGIMLPFQTFSQAVAAAIAGVIYDATASYTPVFILLTILSLVGLICAFLARPPKLPANG